jgi:hypothetical protein
MKAIELTGSIDEKGQLSLDQTLEITTPSRVRVILLLPETTDEIEENDPDDTSIDEIKSSLRRALQQARAGKTRPLSELWDRIDVE